MSLLMSFVHHIMISSPLQFSTVKQATWSFLVMFKKQELSELNVTEHKSFTSCLLFTVTTCVLENAPSSSPSLCTRWRFCPSSATFCCSSLTGRSHMPNRETLLRRWNTWGGSSEGVFWWVRHFFLVDINKTLWNILHSFLEVLRGFCLFEY